jgi:hypothetical protein
MALSIVDLVGIELFGWLFGAVVALYQFILLVVSSVFSV